MSRRELERLVSLANWNPKQLLSEAEFVWFYRNFALLKRSAFFGDFRAKECGVSSLAARFACRLRRACWRCAIVLLMLCLSAHFSGAWKSQFKMR